MKETYKKILLKLKNNNVVLEALLVLAVLMMVDYVNPSSKIPIPLLWGLIIIIGLICIWIIFTTNFYKLYSLEVINSIDMLFVLIELVSIGYLIFLLIELSFYHWMAFKNLKGLRKICICLVILVIIIIFQFHRIKKKLLSNNQLVEKNRNLIDLVELEQGINKENRGQPILLIDRPVKHDLLDRTIVIDALYEAINRTYSSNTYVIGLTGDWGIGKTTISEIVQEKLNKENRDIKIIKDLDIWAVGSQEALLTSLNNALLNAVGINYNSLKMKTLLNRVSKLVVNITKEKIFDDYIFNKRTTQTDIKELQSNLKDYIVDSKNRYVFFIDNLDRAARSQVIFLLKMLGTLFDLPNLIFVLLYDKGRLGKILNGNTELNASFAEKVINQEISVPEVSQEKRNQLYKKCLINLLEGYGINEKEIKIIEPSLELIINNIKSIRDLKRIINSVFYFVFKTDTKLNNVDLLLIEYIHFEDPQLYRLIKENKRYFVSQDIDYSKNKYYMSESTEEYKRFWDNLKDNYSNYLLILGKLFPIIQKYYESNEIDLYDKDDIEKRKKLNICSDYYFDLYFSFSKNVYSEINNRIKESVEKIKSSTIPAEIEQAAKEIINFKNIEDRKLNTSIFEIYLFDIEKKKRKYILKLMLKNINKFSSQRLHILFDLFNELEINEVMDILKNSLNNYELISTFYELISYYEKSLTVDLNEKDINNSTPYTKVYLNDKIIKYLKNMLEKWSIEIFASNIDLYTDRYYVYRNIWGLYSFLIDQTKSSKKFSSYINSILSNKNIFRVLFDVIEYESQDSNNYFYKIEDESFKKLGLEPDKLDSIIANNTPKNESQKIILDAYTRYKNEKQYNTDPVERVNIKDL